MTSDLGKFILRLGVGGLMIFHGIFKLIHGFDFIINQLTENGLPKWLWLGVPVGEIVAPFFLIIGFATRMSGAVIAFTMFMTFFLVKGMAGFSIDPNTGGLNAELNILFLMSALAITLIGPGSIRLYRGKSGFLL